MIIEDKRINYIDIMRGIGIILVCLAHSIKLLEEPLNRIILLFYMPLFFFVSGMVFYNKEPGNFLGFLKKRTLSLLIPQLVLAFLVIVEQLLIALVKRSMSLFLEMNILSAFLNWFLIVLFIGEMACWLVFNFIKKKIYIVLISLVFALAFLLCDLDIIFLQQTLSGVFFMLIGFLLRPLIEKLHQKYGGGCLACLLVVVIILSNLNSAPVGMHINQYGNKIMFMIGAILGIIVVADISVLLERVRPLRFFGRNSIIVYVTHGILATGISGVMNIILTAITNVGGLNRAYPWYLLVWLIVLLIEIPIIMFCKRFTPWLFGKPKMLSKRRKQDKQPA